MTGPTDGYFTVVPYPVVWKVADERKRHEDDEVKDGAAQDPKPDEPTVDPEPPEDDE